MAEKRHGRQVRRRQLNILPPIDVFAAAVEADDAEEVVRMPTRVRAGLPQAMRDAAARELRTAHQRNECVDPFDIVRVTVH